jgi:hypothetical protein
VVNKHMTPLQVHAAAACLTNETDPINGKLAISAHRMQTVMDSYATNSFSVGIGFEIAAMIAAIDADIEMSDSEKAAAQAELYAALPPVAIDVFDPAQVPLVETETNSGTMASSVSAYCNYVLCSGDIGKFSQVVDKVSGFSASVGDVFATIERAKDMTFSDFGPDVKDFSGVVNMGMGAVLGPVAASIRTAIAQATVPADVTPGGQADTDSVVVSTVMSAQGDISGAPGSPDYGTVIGIWKNALSKNQQAASIIFRSLIENVGIVLTYKIANIPAEYFKYTLVTNYEISDVERVLAEMRARSEQAEVSIDDSFRAYAAPLMTLGTKPATENMFGRENSAGLFDKYSADKFPPLSKARLDEALSNETVMRSAFDAVDVLSMATLFSLLGVKNIQLPRLSNWSSILDLSQLAQALPAPVTSDDRNPEITNEDLYSTEDIETLAVEQAVLSGVAGIKLNGTNITSTVLGGITAPNIATLAKKGIANLGDSIVGGVKSFGTNLVNDVTNVGKGIVADANALAGRATAAMNKFNKLSKEGPANLSKLGSKLSNIKGLTAVAGAGALSSLARGIETGLPAAGNMPNLLGAITELMPQGIVDKIRSVVGTGSNADGGFRIHDFLGSAVGLNQHIERWEQVTTLLNELWDTHGESLRSEIEVQPEQADKIAALNNFWALYGGEVDAVYASICGQTNGEWQLLTRKAEVKYNQLQPASISSGIGFAKKLAQHATKLDSGLAEIVQLAADPSTTGGQILLGVIVEARNIKLMQALGLNPVNKIEKLAVPARVLKQDREKLAAIDAASGNPGSVSPEELARSRAIAAADGE